MKQIKSEKPYNVIAAVIFFFGVGFFGYMGVYDWMPAITLVFGATLAIRSLLMRSHMDAFVIIIIFTAIFLSSFIQLFARVFLPAFVMLGTLYYILRQFIEVKKRDVHIGKSEIITEEKNEKAPPL